MMMNSSNSLDVAKYDLKQQKNKAISIMYILCFILLVYLHLYAVYVQFHKLPEDQNLMFPV